MTDQQFALVTLIEEAFAKIYRDTDQLPVRGEAPADVWAALTGFCPKMAEPYTLELNGIPIKLDARVSFGRRFFLYLADERMIPV
jgi:hypothetical protein